LETLQRALDGQVIIGVLPFAAGLARADLEGRPAEISDPVFAGAVAAIGDELERRLKAVGYASA
jgi:hypothetical protein